MPAINTPTQRAERILTLDVLRGLAVLGILVMNIQSYAIIEAAYMNPTAYGDFTDLNRIVWILSHLFAQQKFVTIFSLLFGAGILLFTDRLEARGHSFRKLHYRRMVWLLLIGLLHAYLLWYGDILVTYALCAMWVVLCRRWPSKLLLMIGGFTFAFASFLYLYVWFSLPYMSPQAYEEINLSWQPNSEMIEHELTTYRRGWLDQMPVRVEASFRFEVFAFFLHSFWQVSGLMLIGMALFKWGVFEGARSRRFYLILAGVGLGLGLPIVAYGIVQNFAASWTVDYSPFLGSQFNYWGSLLVALGYCGVAILLTKIAQLKSVTHVLGAVGRMALTNYLMQTLICTTMFYGHGLGLYGQVERSEQILIVVGIWAIQLTISPFWLRYYHFGPAEWIWRSLTYRQLQPFRKIPQVIPVVSLTTEV